MRKLISLLVVSLFVFLMATPALAYPTYDADTGLVSDSYTGDKLSEYWVNNQVAGTNRFAIPAKVGDVLQIAHYLNGERDYDITYTVSTEPYTPVTEPTAVPTETPTTEPTAVPTEAPTAEPTAAPTEEPTAEPTEEPTAAPTEAPTEEPTIAPTEAPTEAPTAEPTATSTATPAPTATATATAKATTSASSGSSSNTNSNTDIPQTGDGMISIAMIVAMMAVAAVVLIVNKTVRNH